MRILIAVLAACIAAVAEPALAKDARAQASGKLDGAMAVHRARGYRAEPRGPDLDVSLRVGDAFLWRLDLRAGVNYRIFGACDDDCSDMDMEVYGADGMLAERDDNRDAAPFVQITPALAGPAYVRLWVYECAAEPCAVAARVVSGGRPEVRPEEADEGAPEENEYTAHVREALTRAHASHFAAGYREFRDDVIAPLSPGDDGRRIVVRLEAGRSYLFQGACDQDCPDVDLEVLDPLGARVAVDVETDALPKVGVAPAQTGDYTVRIWLAQCTSAPCFAGVRSYARPAR